MSKDDTLDLHGSSHDEGRYRIEKFITDNLDTLPVKVITGHSSVFSRCVKDVADRYQLFCYEQHHMNPGCWVVLKSPWF